MVSKATVGPGFTGWALTLDYYADHQQFLKSSSTLRWSTPEICAAEGHAFSARWHADAPAIAYGCDKSGGQAGLVVFWLSDETDADWAIKVETLPGSYSSTAACNTDRARVEGAVARSGSTVYGTLCGLSAQDSAIRMQVFTPGYGAGRDNG